MLSSQSPFQCSPSPASRSREQAIVAGLRGPAFVAGLAFRLPFLSRLAKAEVSPLRAMTDLAVGAFLGAALTAVVLTINISAKGHNTLQKARPAGGPDIVCEQDAIEHFICVWQGVSGRTVR